MVLLSRIEGLHPSLGEALLRPGEPLFEYWGHEASWIPMKLYPVFAFRRREFAQHPWYGDVIGEHPDLADELLTRIADEGPLRSIDLESAGGGWWQVRPIKRVALALWSRGDIAIRERSGFQRSFDLADRVIPEKLRSAVVPYRRAISELVDRSLAGHGWATTTTIVQTFRLTRHRQQVEAVLKAMESDGRVRRCRLATHDDTSVDGWIRPSDRELADRLERVRPRTDRGVLLSPFDPVLWDRQRVQQLFGFEQVLEIYKPAAKRRFGYYCLPVLAGEQLVARVDLKARRGQGRLDVLSCHFEATQSTAAQHREAVRTAIARLAASLELEVATMQ